MPRLFRAASVDEIPVGRGKAVAVDGRELALFNGGHGRYYACAAWCPHEDGPLADGALLGETIVCPWHGFDFDARTGACGAAPDLAVPVYPARVVGADVLVELP